VVSVDAQPPMEKKSLLEGGGVEQAEAVWKGVLTLKRGGSGWDVPNAEVSCPRVGEMKNHRGGKQGLRKKSLEGIKGNLERFFPSNWRDRGLEEMTSIHSIPNGGLDLHQQSMERLKFQKLTEKNWGKISREQTANHWS